MNRRELMRAAYPLVQDGWAGCAPPAQVPARARQRWLGAARVGAAAQVQAVGQLGQERHGGEADDDVDGVGGRAGAQDLLDDVEVEERDQGPVEGAEQDERE